MEIRNISTEKLLRHPQNPRKNIGDVTELAESIKAKGILQNLTVVPADGDTFYVVIGNRRMEAAKAAGVAELPCVISDMDEKEQIQTMLLENIQRVDLTVKEQADGFQLMMDIGMSVDELSEKTGFAKSTIYHRLNIAKLNSDILSEKEDQMTVADLILLEKIKDVNTRNRILKIYGGTSSFEYQVRAAVDGEKRQAKKNEIIEKVKAAGVPEAEEKCTLWDWRIRVIQQINYGYGSGEIPDEIEDGEFWFDTGSIIAIAKKAEARKILPEEEEHTRQRKEQEEKQRLLREVESCINKKYRKVISESVLGGRDITLTDEERIRLILHISDECITVGEVTEEFSKMLTKEQFLSWEPPIDIDDEEEPTEDAVMEQVAKTITKTADILLLSFSASGYTTLQFCTYWNKRHENADRSARIIEIAKKIGLVLSEEEEAVVDGSSELYEEE